MEAVRPFHAVDGFGEKGLEHEVDNGLKPEVCARADEAIEGRSEAVLGVVGMCALGHYFPSYPKDDGNHD